MRDGLEFVHANLDPVTVVLGAGVLSATRWREGEVREHLDLATTAAMLTRLHAATADGLPRWMPLVRADFADDLRSRLEAPWDAGPLASQAHAALHGRIEAIAGWTQRYHALADLARGERWVPTHGEPHERNQLVTPEGTVLVDWESLKLAPRERDLRVLVEAGALDLDVNWPMVEMFDLEWRLDEISQYADWFESPHSGNASDRVALGGLARGARAGGVGSARPVILGQPARPGPLVEPRPLQDTRAERLHEASTERERRPLVAGVGAVVAERHGDEPAARRDQADHRRRRPAAAAGPGGPGA